ncbi:MAG: flagellar basal body-associated FliL family protein [Planctomycetaceae bacterium]|nr:flagellar basal body-associated FliL family protein [Planctomycetaceae bacterium]
MAKAEPVVESVEETPVQPIPSKSKLLILLAFSAVVLLEMIILLFFLPKSPVSTTEKPVKLDSEIIPGHKPEDWLEFPITDPFQCMITAEDGIGGFMLRAKFTLKHEKNKLSRLTNLYDKVKDEIRGEIRTILCSSKIEDFSDPNLTTIKNRILRRLNEVFAEPQPLVKEIVVVDFNYTPM